MYHQPKEVLVSLLLILLVLGIGVWLISDIVHSRPTFSLNLPAGPSLTAGDCRYVYAWRDGLVRIGQMHIYENQQGSFVPFPEYSSTINKYPRGIIFKNDLMNFWRITAAPSKDKLTSAMQTLLSSYLEVFKDFVHSDYFKQTYLPRLEQVIGDNFQQTVTSKQTKAKIDKLYQVAQKIIVANFEDEVMPILLDVIFKTLKSKLSQDPMAVFGLFSTGELRKDIKHELIRNLQNHPDFQENMSASIDDLLRSPKVRKFTQQIATDLFFAMIRDPRFTALLIDLTTDTQLQNNLRMLSNKTAKTLINVGHMVLTRPDGRSLDPFAARVVSQLIFGKETWLILVLSQDQFTRIRDLGFPHFNLKRAGNV